MFPSIDYWWSLGLFHTVVWWWTPPHTIVLYTPPIINHTGQKIKHIVHSFSTCSILLIYQLFQQKKKNVFFYRFPQHYSFIFFYRSIREHLWITNHLNVSPAKLHMNTWIPHNVDRSRKLLKLQLYKCHKKYKLKVKFIVLIKKWSLILNVLCIRDALNCHHN